MAKSKTAWWKLLDKDGIREAMEEATVDCYGDEEQLMGIVNMLEEEIEFPFQVEVFGQIAEVVAIETPNDDALGLDLVCKTKIGEFRIEPRNVTMLDPLPVGHLFLAAYLDWKSRF